MRKVCLRLTAVTALVLGAWVAYGAAGPNDLATVSDREALAAVGGQASPTCYELNWKSDQCADVGVETPKGFPEDCPGGYLYAIDFGKPDPAGAYNLTPNAFCYLPCGMKCNENDIINRWYACEDLVGDDEILP